MPYTKIGMVVLLVWFLSSSDATAALPVLTPGQAVDVREGDTWSGATFVKQEGRRLQVRYSDGTDEWVTADRLRVAGATAGNAGSGGGGGGGSAGVTLEGPFTQIHLQPSKRGPRRSDSTVYVKPTTRPTATFTDLTPAVDPGLRHVDELLQCPDTPGAYVAVGQTQADETPLLCIDVNKTPASILRVFTAHDHRILGVADGGRVLLTQPTAYGALTLHLWEYRGEKYELKANYTFVADGKNRHPDRARLLSPTRLLLRSEGGNTFLIDLASKQQLGFIDCSEITIHCSGQYLLTTVDQAGVFLRPSDLAIVGQVANGGGSFSVDAAGTYATSGNLPSIQVVKLGSKQTVCRAVGISGSHVDLLGPTDMLVDGHVYYDLKSAIPVWRYGFRGGKTALLPNGQMLIVSTWGGETMVCMAALPDPAAINALSSASPDKFLISPGAHVAITGDLAGFGDAAAAHTNIEHALAAAGHKADDAAVQYKLMVRVQPGPTGKFSVREFNMMGPPVVRDYDAPSTTASVTLTRDGSVIWQRNFKFVAEVIVMRQHGESMEQAIARCGRPDANRLNFLDIPGYIVKGGDTQHLVTLGSSVLEHGGFVPATTQASAEE